MELNNHWGRLERVPLRTGWENEADDFTPWLAEEENILLLGNAIGIDLEIEAQEKKIGQFRADILCKDTATDQWVLVENQLERTDHIHLGQLITYAAGLSTVTIIWISSEFTDEHRGALDWLNEITPDEIRFFGIEIELWRIRDSPMAPKFNIVSKPNEWTKPSSGVRRRFAANNITATKQLQLEYWEALHEFMKQSDDSAVRPTKPQPQHWQQFSIGRTGFLLRTLANTRDKSIGVRLILEGDDAKGHFGLLLDEKDEIEQEAGKKFEWRKLPTKKESQINLRWEKCDPADRKRWPDQHEWLFRELQNFHKVFAARIKQLIVEDFAIDK